MVHSDVRATVANVDLFCESVFTKDMPKTRVACFLTHTRGTGVSGLTRGLATLPQGGSRSLQWSEIRTEDPREDPWQCTASVCSGSALLGDLLEVSRSKECDLQSVLSIYPRIFLCIFIVYRRLVRILCLLLYSAIC